ncbi:MAG: MFS transporter [Candidatus Portnoybacteria bacterium]
MFSFNKKYFDKPLSHGFVSLFTGRTIVLISSAFLGLFLPIFLFELFGQNIRLVLIYYGIGFFLYGLSVAIGARFLNRYGFKRALQTSVFLGAFFYVIFYFINQDNWRYLIPFTIITIVLYRLSFWLPYHVDFAKFSDKKNRCRQVSIFEATRLGAGIFIPLISGYIITRFGFDVLFIISIFLYLISGIPYLSIPRTREKFSWSLKRTWQEYLSKKRRKMVLVYAARGAESVTGSIVWPIFIYQLLDGDYFQIGFISTFIIAITAVMQIVMGKYFDSGTSKEKVLKWGSLFYSIGWIIKIFIATAFQVFVVGVYHNISAIFTQTPFNALNYEIMADQGHYVDEFTVLREMSIHLGTTLMLATIFGLSFFLAIKWVFLLAALAAFILGFLRRQEPIMEKALA